MNGQHHPMGRVWTRRIVSATLALFAVVFLTGCSNADFNITGNWRITFTLEKQTPGQFSVALNGTKTSGVVIWKNQQAGSYSVNGKAVDIVLRVYVMADGINKLFIYQFQGEFNDENNMSGDMAAMISDIPGSGEKGTWSGVRI